MVKKALGYVELEWKCSQCGTMNPGPQKFCSGCGAQQPKKVAFQQKAEDEIITDESEIAKIKAGADVHCAFCSARNPATAERCTQCGASLETATARESGQVLGAHRDKSAAPIKCPQCGASNLATAFRCSACNASLKRPGPKPGATSRKSAPTKASSKLKLSPLLIVAAGVGLLGIFSICVLVILSSIPKEEVIGTVVAVAWKRSIEIEELGNVTKSGWEDDIPPNANVGSCAPKKHHTQDNPAPGAREVCGTPYTVDRGTGHGEVVQDCRYEVYEDWCNYTVKEWKKVDTIKLTGNDYNPRWPDLNLRRDQREGARKESYNVEFRTEKKDYTYATSNLDKFKQCQIDSKWKLEINMLGRIKSIERKP